MNIKRLLSMSVPVVLFLVLGLSWSPATANAGILQWLGMDGEDIAPLAESVNYASNLTLDFDLTDTKDDTATILDNAVVQNHSHVTPKTNRPAKARTYVVEASGYSSTHDQTDDTPFITASGTYVRDGVIAANFLPIGTVVKIPDLFGNKMFIVEDRMNKRYWMNIDVWFASREAALQFGRKHVKIEIVS